MRTAPLGSQWLHTKMNSLLVLNMMKYFFTIIDDDIYRKTL